MKAMYARHDAANLYVGVVCGMNPLGVKDPDGGFATLVPGDLAINPDWSHATAWMGIITPIKPALDTAMSARVREGGTWVVPHPWFGNDPPPYISFFKCGTELAPNATFKVSDTGVDYFDTHTGKDVSIYLYEYTLPLSYLESAEGTELELSWGVSCANDSLSLDHALVTVPEPAMAGVVLVGGLAAMLRRRRS